MADISPSDGTTINKVENGKLQRKEKKLSKISLNGDDEEEEEFSFQQLEKRNHSTLIEKDVQDEDVDFSTLNEKSQEVEMADYNFEQKSKSAVFLKYKNLYSPPQDAKSKVRVTFIKKAINVFDQRISESSSENCVSKNPMQDQIRRIASLVPKAKTSSLYRVQHAVKTIIV